MAHYNLGVASLRANNRGAALNEYHLLLALTPSLADKLYTGIYHGKVLVLAGR